MLNFLQNAGFVSANNKISNIDTGDVIIKNFPIDQYSAFQIIVTNASANISKSFEVPKQDPKINLRDLRLVS
jgi:hypothetical protein